MNDQDVITAVRDRFGGVQMSTPLDTVSRRGRALRARRRGSALAAGAAAAGGLALAVTSLLPATSTVTGAHHTPGGRTARTPGGSAVSATLDAWTLTRRPDGTIAVTIRNLHDPAGLQRALRTDGVPARVTYPQAHIPAACHFYDLGSAAATRALLARTLTVPGFKLTLAARNANFVIHPAAIPPGAGLLVTGAAMPASIRAMPGTLGGNPAERTQTAVLGVRTVPLDGHTGTVISVSFLETSLVHTTSTCTGR
jgi:hypothetical protein